MKNKIIAAALAFVLVLFPMNAGAYSTPKITEPCGLTVEELAAVLPPELAPYATDFIQAEKMTDDGNKCVNAVFLAAIARLESGNGKSKLAKMKNNLFGWKDRDGYKSFTTVRQGVLFVADRLKKNYIDNGRDSITSIGKRYCNDEWSRIITGIYGGMSK